MSWRSFCGLAGAEEWVGEVDAEGCCCGARADMYRSATSEVEDAEFTEEATAPDHVGEWAVDKGGPEL